MNMTEEHGLDIWAQRRFRCLKEHRPVHYTNLLTSGALDAHLQETEAIQLMRAGRARDRPKHFYRIGAQAFTHPQVHAGDIEQLHRLHQGLSGSQGNRALVAEDRHLLQQYWRLPRSQRRSPSQVLRDNPTHKKRCDHKPRLYARQSILRIHEEDSQILY